LKSYLHSSFEGYRMCTSYIHCLIALSRGSYNGRRTYFRSSLARRVEVVVPSPAKMFVLPATLFISRAPMSSALTGSIIDLTTVTPSFVILGSPASYSSATFLPYRFIISELLLLQGPK
jgi:hypothetical protein